MRIKSFLIVLISLFLCGCVAKEKIVYKDVYLPIKCSAQMPLKPTKNSDFKTHKSLMIYFLECESTLKHCLGLENE